MRPDNQATGDADLAHLEGEGDGPGLEAAYPSGWGEFAYRWNHMMSDESRAAMLRMLGSGHVPGTFATACNAATPEDRDEWLADAIRASEIQARERIMQASAWYN